VTNQYGSNWLLSQLPKVANKILLEALSGIFVILIYTSTIKEYTVVNTKKLKTIPGWIDAGYEILVKFKLLATMLEKPESLL
jgi:hypothetical protein